MASNYTPSTWAVAVLHKLGYTPTPGAVKALAGWAQAEGGHWNNSARYNPLNTTQAEPGYQTFQSVGQGSAPIGIYKNWQQGIDATVKTLKNGRYDGILAGLQAGDPGAVANAIGQSPWGTSGALVRQTIGAASGAVPRGARPATAPRPGPSIGGTTTTRTTTTPGVDNSQLRRSLIADFLGSGGVKSTQATQSLAAGWLGAQDIPGTSSTATSTTPGRTAPRAARPAASNQAHGSTPTGTATFDGKTVAAWIKPALVYARAHGWKGTVNSGFRSFAEQTRIYNSGVRPAAKPGTSNHEGSDFPRGAVDVSEAAQLSAILANSPYASKLQWAGAKDPVHFSHPHNGSY